MSSVSALAQSFHSGGRALERIRHPWFDVLPPDEDGAPTRQRAGHSMTDVRSVNGGVKMYRRWSGPLGSDSWIELI